MGNYALKQRIFFRLKLFIYNMNRVRYITRGSDRLGKQIQLAVAHIREFRRLHFLRSAYHMYVSRGSHEDSWTVCHRPPALLGTFSRLCPACLLLLLPRLRFPS